MPNLKSRTITTIDEIAKIDFGIDAVVETPFVTRAWLTSWCKHFLCVNDSIRVIVVSDGDKVVGIAPLCIQRTLGKGNVLRFLGNGEVCSDYQTFPCASPHYDAFVSELPRELHECVHEWDRIELDGVRTDNSLVSALISALKKYELTVNTQKIASCWRLPLPSTIEEHLAQSSRNYRKKARRKLRLFEVGSVEAIEASDALSLEEGYEVLRVLHQRRRISLGEPGCFASEKFDRFLIEAAGSLLNEGTLRLFWLQISGEPIAAEIAIKSANGIFAYQAGISPDHLEHEPGRLANLWHIKRAIDDGLDFVDFLRGDEPYKSRLHATPIECVKYEVVPRKLKSQACQTVINVGRNLKSLWSGSALAAT